MTKQTVLALFCALAVSACTSMRLEGFVTDEKTGEPIHTAGITIGEKYVHVDTAGHYVVNVRNYWKTMNLVAPGYVSKSVAWPTNGPRYQKFNVQMTPSGTAKVPAPKAAPVEGGAAKAPPPERDAEPAAETDAARP
jgi:hypothetical protein